MKLLLKLFLGLVLLCILAIGVGYIIITRPAFQKNLIESRLPAGSSLRHVQITAGSVELVELKLILEDGTTVKVERVNTGFSPLAAVFDNTIQIEGLNVEGLLVELPKSVESVSSYDAAPIAGVKGSDVPSPEPEPVEAAEPSSPADLLYVVGQLEWLFDIDSINIDGVFIDPAQNRYIFELTSGQIAPGQESELEASLALESGRDLQGGLQDFSSDIRVQFVQNAGGGFESLSIHSTTQGSDAAGNNLLSASQTLDLAVDGFGESAVVELAFNADLPKPEVFAPELGALQGLSIQGALKAGAVGDVLTLTTADFEAASNGATVATVELKQSLTLGAQQQFAGELMDIDLTGLPLDWINPWLSGGLTLSGSPLTAQIAVSGESDGSMNVVARSPIVFGPFWLHQDGQLLLDNVTVQMNPIIRLESDGMIHYDLGDFQVMDRYGFVFGGTLLGSKSPLETSSPFSGLNTEARLDVSLPQLISQPVAAGRTSILAGQMKLRLNIDAEAEYPAQIQTSIVGLQAQGMPSLRQNYRFATQLKQSDRGTLSIGSNFEAGPEGRVTTSIQIGGQLNPEEQPLPFRVNLSSPRITQADVDLLLAAFKAGDSQNQPNVVSQPRVSDGRSTSTGAPVQLDQVDRPAWADLDGSVSIEVDAIVLTSGQVIRGFTAEAQVSETLLALDRIEANLGEGNLEGSARVNYDSGGIETYRLVSTLNFENIDPSIFSRSSSGAFPVRGLFDGQFELAGAGATLEHALDASEGALTITGRDGILTAFELDNRSQLGLIGAGILGQHLERPGITAMAQAVPYFKDMQFENFTLRLTRGQDQIVRIPELNFLGDNLRIDGQGFIAASSLREVLNQPLTMSIGLGAKGLLVDYLETLQLLGPVTREDGFRDWKSDINIGGTLVDPDTSALQEMLSEAARRAIIESPPPPPSQQQTQEQVEQPNGGNQPQQQAVEADKEKTKEEQVIDDIEMGLDLLNSVLGN